MVITSKANPTVKKIASLADKKFRNRFGEYSVEGVKCVDECIAAGKQIDLIACTEGLSNKYSDAVVLSEELFSRISTEKSPQGVIACVKLPDVTPRPPVGACILLDRLQDPGNVGTIIRTANAAGYDDVYLLNCADAFSPKAVRGAMGGLFHINIYEGSGESVTSALKDVRLICADMNGADVFSFTPPEKFCLCIGNEGNGLSDEIRALADCTIKIPMRKTCESLNAAVSAAIAMYALKNNR